MHIKPSKWRGRNSPALAGHPGKVQSSAVKKAAHGEAQPARQTDYDIGDLLGALLEEPLLRLRTDAGPFVSFAHLLDVTRKLYLAFSGICRMNIEKSWMCFATFHVWMRVRPALCLRWQQQQHKTEVDAVMTGTTESCMVIGLLAMHYHAIQNHFRHPVKLIRILHKSTTPEGLRTLLSLSPTPRARRNTPTISIAHTPISTPCRDPNN